VFGEETAQRGSGQVWPAVVSKASRNIASRHCASFCTITNPLAQALRGRPPAKNLAAHENGHVEQHVREHDDVEAPSGAGEQRKGETQKPGVERTVEAVETVCPTEHG